MSCFFSVAYTKMNWPNQTLFVFALLMVYPFFQWLNSFNRFQIKKWKWNLSLIQFQQKKIRSLEKTIDSLKTENKLLADEITGLHQMWMTQPPPAASQKKPVKETIIKAPENAVEQIEYLTSLEIIPAEKTQEKEGQWQEMDLREKSPL